MGIQVPSSVTQWFFLEQPYYRGAARRICKGSEGTWLKETEWTQMSNELDWGCCGLLDVCRKNDIRLSFPRAYKWGFAKNGFTFLIPTFLIPVLSAWKYPLRDLLFPAHIVCLIRYFCAIFCLVVPDFSLESTPFPTLFTCLLCCWYIRKEWLIPLPFKDRY